MLVSDGDKKPHLINCEAICVHEEGARIQQSWIRGFRMSALQIEKGWCTMSNLLSYKNYNGTVEYSREDSCLFGKVVGIKSLLSYEGNSVQELEQDFCKVIDEYLEDCNERNIEPEQPYKGTFNVRISPELHRNVAIYALEHGKSLNSVVEEAIGMMVCQG